MNTSILHKLESIKDRFEELALLLSDAQVIAQQDHFKKLSQEYAEIEPIVEKFKAYQKALIDLQAAKILVDDPDPDMALLGTEGQMEYEQLIQELTQEINILLLPKDQKDQCNVYLEIRSGTGGDEASIFSGDLFRMYNKYAEKKGWKCEVLSSSVGEHGGFKEIITRIVGTSVYKQLKFESGAHRVQRVPETESQGRIHTSACTVAILAEPNEQASIELKKEDLRIDTYRSSGAGGQHVNTTDSAVRITHIPTGTVVECQQERSQHKNKAKAMALLTARIEESQRETMDAEISEARRLLVGSGDRSQRIRTYNFPQGRVTDHRIGLTLYKLDEFMAGNLDIVIEPLLHEFQVKQLLELSDNT